MYIKWSLIATHWGNLYRDDYLQYSHILPNALFCVLSVLQEVTSIKDSYRKKAKMTTEVLNSMENVKCNEVAGAMYAFPRITLQRKLSRQPRYHVLFPALISSATLQNTVSNGYPRCTVIRIPEPGNFFRVDWSGESVQVFEIGNLDPVVHKMDSSIHRINHYPVDRYERNQLHYPLDRDLSSG